MQQRRCPGLWANCKRRPEPFPCSLLTPSLGVIVAQEASCARRAAILAASTNFRGRALLGYFPVIEVSALAPIVGAPVEVVTCQNGAAHRASDEWVQDFKTKRENAYLKMHSWLSLKV